MKAIKVIKSLGPIDIRSVRRDSLLGWMVFIPVLGALILRLAVPPLTRWLLETYGFDLSPYYPAILSYFFILMCPILFGMVVGFLLLDERDDDTLTALQVTPLTLPSYLAYRVTIPVILSFVLMFVIFPIIGLGTLDFGSLLITSLVAAPMAPLFALFMATFAQNKVQGFAVMKASGSILFAPIIAFFIDSPWALVFGIIPTYWPNKVYWLLEAGEPQVLVYALVGLFYQFVLIAWLLRRFNRVLHR